MRRHRVTKRLLAAAAVIATVALAGCSPGMDYPSLFPAVHDMPPPRTDTTMDADQIQQATETLISERNRLSAEAQAAAQDKTKAPASSTTAKKPPAASARSGSAATSTAAATAAPGTAGAADTPAAAAQAKP